MTQRLRIGRLRAAHAREILGWRYAPPYDFYDPPDDAVPDHYVAAFLDPELHFHAILNPLDELVGFCSYGKDGQVPGGDYSMEALDIGLGMKPELTGQGLGRAFFEAILSYAGEICGVCRYRVTVATFNRRAMRVYRNCGFREFAEFRDARFNVPHTVMILDPGR